MTIKLEAFERSPKMSEIKAVYRSRTRSRERTTIREARTAVEYLREVWDQDTLELKEEFLMLCLNTGHQAIGWVKVSSGGYDSAGVDPRVVFSLALQAGASALIVAHNHPSGLVEPSEQDRRVTERLREAGKLLGIELLDHIILGREEHFSFAEHGMI
jgi:DNA repair protein RadC